MNKEMDIDLCTAASVDENMYSISTMRQRYEITSEQLYARVKEIKADIEYYAELKPLIEKRAQEWTRARDGLENWLNSMFTRAKKKKQE